MGGMTGLGLAIDHPGRVGRLICCHRVAHYHGESSTSRVVLELVRLLRGARNPTITVIEKLTKALDVQAGDLRNR